MSNPFITTVPPEAIGLEASLSPLLQFNTAQRITMFSSNIWQALNIHGAEFPRVASGNENQVGKYSLNASARKDDATAYATIPKFPSIGPTVSNNPKFLMIVVYPNRQADAVELSTYVKLSNGYGYMNKRPRATLLANSTRGSFISKETILEEAPSHVDGMYCQGVNANTVYTTMPQATEDAVIISESLAKKCEHKATYTVKIKLHGDEVPINLYGSADDPKAFPDIGECVGESCVLMALRDKRPSNFANLTSQALRSVRYGDDRLVKAPPGSKIIDVQTYFAPRAYNTLCDDPGLMSQIIKYQNMHFSYYEKVLKVYEELKADGLKLSPKLANLVYEALCLRRQRINRSIHLSDKRDKLDNCVIEITYSYTRQTGIGFKFAGRAGDKGVASVIWKDEDMPVDEQGIRADMVISPESVSNRTNASQLYEQFFNRMGTLMTQRLRRGELGEGVTAYNKLIEFVSDVHKEYAHMLDRQNTTDEQKMAFVDDVYEDGLYYIIPPFCSQIKPQQIREIAAKWSYVKSPITFSYDVYGVKKTFTTKQPTSIGSKYVYLLGKIPDMQLAAHEMCYTNQIGIPVKTSPGHGAKIQHTTTPTPQRLGEDELGLLSMSLSEEETARFVMTRASSRTATTKLGQSILEAKQPSNISSISMSTDHMIHHSEMLKLLYHSFGVIGYDLSEKSKGRK